MVDFTKAQSDLAQQTTLINGIVSLLKTQQDTNAQLAQQIADLKAAQGNDQATQSALDALDATVAANNQLLANAMPAIVQNTPTPPADAQSAIQAAAPQPDPNAPQSASGA